MALFITLTEARLTDLLRDAYADGYEDGAAAQGAAVQARKAVAPMTADAEIWADSVTCDHLAALVERVRKGGRA